MATKTPGHHKGMLKGERETRTLFLAEALKLMQRFCLTQVEHDPGSGVCGPVSRFVAMTDAGRLDLTVRDDEVTSVFALPRAAREFVDCNPHSGKWNHHAFLSHRAHGKAAGERWNAAHVEAVLGGLEHGLSALNARAWIETPVSVTRAEAAAAGPEELARRTAMGERVTVSDWDRAAALDFYAAHVTCVDGTRPDWLVRSAVRDDRPDSVLFFRLRDWCVGAGLPEPG